MPRRTFSEHHIYVLDEESPMVFSRKQEAGDFLVPWAYMDPLVKRRSWVGPKWTYQRGGRAATASVPLTVELHSGATAYWDAGEDRCGEPSGVAVKREHARLEGREYRFFGTSFREDNAVELQNRRGAYFLLLNATRGFDLQPLEAELLIELGNRERSFAEMSNALGWNSARVRAAALNLWRRGRVHLPMSESLLTDEWQVRSAAHDRA
jgi:hypothetical protein